MSLIVKASQQAMSTGVHGVRVVDIKLGDNPLEPSKKQLTITLQSLSDSESTVCFWTSPVLHPQGKLVPFLEAVLKRSLSAQEQKDGLDLEMFLGSELSVALEQGVSKAGKAFLKVAEFFPSKN